MNILTRYYRYPTMGFAENFLGGHISIGKWLTIYGANAMRWSINIYNTRWGCIHIDLPTWSRIIGKRTWCMYASPNGTPWACTWYVGTSDPKEKIRAQIRKLHFGHNNKESAYGYGDVGNALYELNGEMERILWRLRS